MPRALWASMFVRETVHSTDPKTGLIYLAFFRVKGLGFRGLGCRVVGFSLGLIQFSTRAWLIVSQAKLPAALLAKEGPTIGTILNQEARWQDPCFMGLGFCASGTHAHTKACIRINA